MMQRALAEMQRIRSAQPPSTESPSTQQGQPTPQPTGRESPECSEDSLPSVEAPEVDNPPSSGLLGQAQASEIIKALTSWDDSTRKEALEQVISAIWPMAVQRHGCRVAQKAFEVADQDQKDLLAEGLRGHIREALESPHGNYVVQKCVESTVKGAEIVLEEMCGAFLFFSRRRFGCRVIERLLENCSNPQVSELARE